MFTLRRLTGLMFITVAVFFTVVFSLLGSTFNYPDVLREPAGDVLTAFAAGGPQLVTLWYLFSISALLFVPLAIMVTNLLAEKHKSGWLTAALVFGVLAGLVQTLGLIRWVFIVPFLAGTYVDPASTISQRETAVLVFEAFHRYAGMAIGEHLGYLFTATWTMLIAWELRHYAAFRRWAPVTGIVFSIGVLAGLLEPAGIEWAGAVNAISYVLWSVWLVAVGAVLAFGRTQPRTVAARVLAAG